MDFQHPLPSSADSSESDARGPQYQPLVAVVVAVAVGIVLDCYAAPHLLRVFANTPPNNPGFLVWWSLAAACLVAWRIARRAPGVSLPTCLLIASVVFVGAAWHHLQWHVYSHVDVGRYATLDTQPACVTATLLSAPETLPAPRRTSLRAIPGLERSRVALEVEAIRDGTTWLPAAGRCQLIVDGHLLGMHAGDRVQVFAQLRGPGPPMNPGEFDFAAWARADRRLAALRTVSPDCVTAIERRGGWAATRTVDRLRAGGQRLLRRYVGDQRAEIASAILLGAREGLTTEDIEPFFLTGTIHLLVVSGLHVGILAMGLYGALRLGWLPRRTALAVIMAVVIGYTLLTGAQPPVVRAGVLVMLMCTAAWIGRRGVAFNSLAAAALVILAINPAEFFQTGTQLSFLAVATLFWANQKMTLRRPLDADPLDRLVAASRPWYRRLIRWLGRWNAWLLAATGAVWLIALPLVLYRFHVVTPIAILISPAVWVLVFVALWAGFLTLLFGWFVPPVAAVCGFICDGALAWLEGVVQWAEGVPGGHSWWPGPALWWVVGFYAGLFAMMIWGRALVRPRWQVALVCAWIVVGVTPPLARAAWRSDALRCSFIAMGHGECIVLEMPGGETLLYDAGSLGSPEYASRVVAGYLWDRGITRLDAIVLSHADVDHYNAVPGLLKRFRVAAVYVSPLMFDRFGATGPGGGPAELQRAIHDAGVPIREIWAGDRLRIGADVAIDVLHPPRQGVIASDNANSVTLAVEYASRRILLPGDLESPGLEDVMAELPYDCDVLLAPHHGSRRSDPPGLAAWCSPEFVVISGRANADSLVRRTYEQAGARVLNTGQDGAVAILLTPDRPVIAATANRARQVGR